MTWNYQFTNSLDQPSKKTEFALLFIGRGSNYISPSGRVVNNDANNMVHLGEAQVTIDNVRITPQRWSVNFGGFSIEIVGDLRPFKGSPWQRGSIAELYMRRNDIHIERVAIGQLRTVSGGRGKWRFEFGDILSAMASRLTSAKNQLSYYYDVGTTTEVRVNYDFAADPNLYVKNATIFQKETPGSGMIRVNRAGTVGYYLWSAVIITNSPSANNGYLVITDTGTWPATANQNTLNIDDEITHLALLKDRPDHIFAKTIMSSGDLSQGSFDTYPESWGSGFYWSNNLIDSTDMNLWQTSWETASGTYEFQLVVEDYEQSGIRYLLSKFLQVGMWPVFRQNALSWRVCQDPNTANPNTLSVHIYDRDIQSVDSHQIYSPAQSSVYTTSFIVVSTASGTKETYGDFRNTINSMPCDQEITRDNRYIYRIDSPIQQIKAQADRKRLKAWDLYTWEELVLSVSERFAGLVAGDIIQITASMIYGWGEAEGKTYNSKRGMILGNRWHPNQSKCILTIGIITK